MRIQTKLTIALLLLSFCVIVIAGIFSTITLDDYFRSRILDELKTQSHEAEFMIRTLTSATPETYTTIQSFAHSAGIRITLIDSAGTVIFESELGQEVLPQVENHLQRPEIQEALQSGGGSNTRQSATLHLDMLYFARILATPLPQATGMSRAEFVRVGIPLTQVNAMMAAIQSKIIIASCIVLVIVSIISIFLSRRLAAPVQRMDLRAQEIRSGNYDQRIPVLSQDELGHLAQTLNGMIDRLNEDIAKLKKLERVRTEFLGNVSHELRTPIFAVQGMLETLLNGAVDDKEVNRTFLERALHNTQRLNTLLGDLIEISRIESGDMKLSFRYFALDEFLGQVAAEMSPLAAQHKVHLTLDQPDHLQVFGDKERLKQVLENLIDNAIKYNRTQGSIRLSAARSDSGVRVSVADTGVGISPEHLPRIFERFYRVDKERSREAGGTGLGLAIVKHIVEAHGSRIEVISEVGNGTTFSFLLGTSMPPTGSHGKSA
ncbi:MAG TPA: ATP-binding protein [Bacteroidota bacterium]|nr:ATP-binding protein [Bacteroidota bacterium]